MRIISYLVTALFFLIVVLTCGKIQTLPPEPRIEYKSFTVSDTVDILGNKIKLGILEFYFEDGDGDLGLRPPSEGENFDTINLFFTLFRKTNGVMVPAPDNDPLKPSGYRIPYMERLGQNKILKGTISVSFQYLFYSENDTIRYDFYVKDRAGNISNTASTSEISLVKGVYTE